MSYYWKNWKTRKINSLLQERRYRYYHFVLKAALVKTTKMDFPRSPLVKNPPAKAGDTVSFPGPWKSTLHRTTKPAHHSYWAQVSWSLCSGIREATETKSPRAATRVAPACYNQWKPPHSHKDPVQPKINITFFKNVMIWCDILFNEKNSFLLTTKYWGSRI